MITFDQWKVSMIRNIEDFVENKIDAITFDNRFFELWPKGVMHKNIEEKAYYYLFHDLFYDVEAFCHFPSLRDEGDIDENQLHQIASMILSRIKQFEEDGDALKVIQSSETYRHKLNAAKKGLPSL